METIGRECCYGWWEGGLLVDRVGDKGMFGYWPCFRNTIGCCVCSWGGCGRVGGARGEEGCGELLEECGYLGRGGYGGEYQNGGKWWLFIIIVGGGG